MRGISAGTAFFVLLCFSSFSLANVDKVMKNGEPWLVFSLKGKPGKSVQFASSFTGWDEGELIMTEYSKGKYSLALPQPWLPYFSYKFIVDGQWVSDPTNPVQEPDGYGSMNSIYETDFTENSLLSPVSQTRSWVHKVIQLNDAKYGARDVHVLVPTFSTKSRLRTVYFNDGTDYLNMAEIENFLANYYLVTGKAYAAVLMPPAARETEYGAAKRSTLEDFLTQVVIPNVEARFPLSSNRKDRIIIGPSLGGLSSLRTGLYAPEFGVVVSQSGSFWYIDKELEKFVSQRTNTPAIYILDGVFEGEGIVNSNQKLQELFQKENITYKFSETPTGHNWLSWRNQFQMIFDWISQQ